MGTAKTENLNERGQQILADIVDAYSEDGQPVGSKALAQKSKLNLSAASIRNVMQDLEKKGYLTHPHTSAGRVPTESGFRYYATQLVEVDQLNDDLKKDIRSVVTQKKEMKSLIKDASNLIGELTGCAGLVTAPKFEKDPLEQIEFVRLSGDRVLVVMVTLSGKIENRVIEVPAFIDMEDLNKASMDMRKVIAGQTLDDAREQLIANLAEQKGQVNAMIDQMMQAANEWGQPVVNDGAMVVAGSTNLFQYPEIVRERLQKLIKMFEEKRLLMSLMEEVKHGEGVQIYIGQDSEASAKGDCAIVANSYGCQNRNIIGTLGVIGPQRMNYKQAIGVVNYTSKLLSQALAQQET